MLGRRGWGENRGAACIHSTLPRADFDFFENFLANLARLAGKLEEAFEYGVADRSALDESRGLDQPRPMKKIASWFVAALFVPVVVGLLVEVATPNVPQWLEWLVTGSAMLLDWAGLPWVLAGGCGFLAGLWFDSICAHYPSSWASKADSLADDAGSVLYDCKSAMRDMAWGNPISADRANGLLVELTDVVNKLKALGLTGPSQPADPNFNTYLQAASAYLGGMIPALRKGKKAFALNVDASLNKAPQKLD